MAQQVTPQLPTDGSDSLLTAFGKGLKRIGTGMALSAPNPAYMQEGFGPELNPDDFSGDKSEQALRGITGVSKPTTIGERALEGVGATIPNIPLAGGGVVPQLVNAGIGIGLPETVHQFIEKPWLRKLVFGSEQDDDNTPPEPTQQQAGTYQEDENGNPVAVPISHPDPSIAHPWTADQIDNMIAHDKYVEPPPAPYAPPLEAKPMTEQDVADATNLSALHTRNDATYWYLGAAASVAIAAATMAAVGRGSSIRAELEASSALTGFMKTPKVQEAFGDAMSNLKGGLLDRNAPLKDAMSAMEPNADANDLFQGRVDTTLNPVAMNQKINHALMTGELPGTSIKMEAPRDWYHDMATQIEPQTAKDFSNYLAAHNEMDSRTAARNNWIGAQGTNAVFALPQPRPGLHDASDSALQQIITDGNNNPVWRDLLERKNDMMDKMLQFARDRGLISGQDYHAMRQAFPNYTPELEGTDKTFWDRIGLNPKDYDKAATQGQLLERTLKDRGGIGKPIDPVISMEQYIQSMMRYAEVNDVRKQFFTAAKTWQTAQTGPAVFRFGLNDVDGANVVQYMDGGTKRFVEVKNPAILSAVNSSPLFTVPLLNTMRVIQQQTITGLAAPWFAPKVAIHNAMRGAIQRPAGTSMGYIDDALQNIGFKFGLPGDPTALLGAGVGAIKGLYGHLLLGARNTLRDSLANNGFLSQRLGPGATQQLADAAADAYARSTVSSFQKAGLGNSVMFGQSGKGDMMSSMAQIVPEYSNRYGMGAARKLMNAYDSILSSIHNGAELHYYDLNQRGNVSAVDEARLARDTRDLIGDPAKTGSNPVVRAATTTLPYSNITLQGVSRYVRAFKDDPKSALVGTMVGLGVPAFTLASWLASLDPQTKNDYYQRLTPEQRASSVYLPIPGKEPEYWPAVSLAPEHRGMWAGFNTALDLYYGLSNDEINRPENAPIKSNLAALNGNRQMQELVSGARKTFLPDMPGALTAFDASRGVKEEPWQSKFGAGPVGGQHFDNVDPTSSKLIDDVISSQHEHEITALFGTLSQLAIDHARAFHYAFKGSDDVGTALKEAFKQTGRDTARQLPMANQSLWSVQSRLSTNNADANMLKTKTDTLTQLSRIFTDQVQNGGLITPQGQSVPYRNDGMDENMSRLLAQADALNRTEIRPMLTKRGGVYAQMNSTDGADVLSGENKESLHNMNAKTVQNIQHAVLDRIAQFEAEISKQQGRRITLEDLLGKRSSLDLP